MKHVTNFPLYNGCLDPYGSMAGLVADCQKLGLDGLEVIWDHMPYIGELPPEGFAVGYHLKFWSHWLDFYRGNTDALLAEYGSWDMVREYFHGDDAQVLVDEFKEDLQRAIDLNAEYVVFHVSDVSIEECFTYRFSHSDEEVIDAAAELVNRFLDGSGARMAFLVENQWWPGLRFTDPKLTRRLLDAIEYDNKGVVLDTGHLLHTNRALRTQAQAAQYIRECFDAHGQPHGLVRALHLQQSLTGEYVEGRGFVVPDDLGEAYWDRYTRCYNHVVQIDRHEPWTDPAIADVVAHIDPEWVNHELSAWPREAHNEAVATQLATLRQG
ncbi:MAG: TIM barrel protein [Eggerthellaceae bacterium]|nr:TIM barrel protein [Eggerthellaceae bacterium]